MFDGRFNSLASSHSCDWALVLEFGLVLRESAVNAEVKTALKKLSIIVHIHLSSSFHDQLWGFPLEPSQTFFRAVFFSSVQSLSSTYIHDAYIAFLTLEESFFPLCSLSPLHTSWRILVSSSHSVHSTEWRIQFLFREALFRDWAESLLSPKQLQTAHLSQQLLKMM